MWERRKNVVRRPEAVGGVRWAAVEPTQHAAAHTSSTPAIPAIPSLCTASLDNLDYGRLLFSFQRFGGLSVMRFVPPRNGSLIAFAHTPVLLLLAAAGSGCNPASRLGWWWFQRLCHYGSPSARAGALVGVQEGGRGRASEAVGRSIRVQARRLVSAAASTSRRW